MSIALRNQNYLDGGWEDSGTGRRYDIYSPADLRQQLHTYPLSDGADVLRAIDSAAIAQRDWARTPVAKRAEILRRTASLVVENREQIAQLITAENGKLLRESHVEIDSTLAELHFQVGEGERQFGRSNPSHNGGAWGFTRTEPLGVVSVIIPWNFPFNVPFRKLVPALMAGNAAVLKPASQTAGVGELVVHLLVEAGLPERVVQYVTGSGGELSDALVGSPEVQAVTFTGSTEVGRVIAAGAAKNFTRTQLEMGGKNPVVALDDADLELTADQVVLGAYSCAGQWCTATSRLIADEKIFEELLELILERVARLSLGFGTAESAGMGPVCGVHQLSAVLAHIERAKSQGARLILGGAQVQEGELAHGCFIEPTIFDLRNGDFELSREEVFGPVLGIEVVSSLEQAIESANGVRYGLSSSVFTTDLDRALEFCERVESGMTHVNMHSAYKEPQFCFGGIKESGFGLPEAGSAGIQFFQEEKAVYIRR